MQQPASQAIDGQVEAVNERGVKLGGQWFNVSKYADVPLPMKGARVALTLDRQGFIRAVDVLDVESPAAAPTSSSPTAKDVMIVRQTALKAAAEFCASRPDAQSGHVLVLAERWARWVLDGSPPAPPCE